MTMSALGGIYHWDGAPVDEWALTALGNSLATFGPDGGREIRSGSIGMAYRAFHTNRESRRERQPLASRHGQMLAWDGRLDNREELIGLLRGAANHESGDAEIVMGMYQRWGVDFLPRLVGDFALSLWDPMSRTLLLARDPFGVRTLFYRYDADGLLWASDLRAILDVPGVEVEIDDEYIAGFLTRFPETWQTPYKNIYAVPHGSVVSVYGQRLRVQPFWSPQPNRELSCKSDAEYEERFRELFRESVRCRLRTDRPIMAQLSGGLDSSSIVCVADQLIECGEAQAPALETLSYVYGEARTADETKFIRCVEEQRGRKGFHLKEEEGGCLSLSADEFFVSAPTFNHCFAERQRQQREAMKASNTRILLTGQGGDQLLYSSDNPDVLLADFIAQRKFFQLHQQLQTWSRALKRPYFDLLKLAAVSFLPRPYRSNPAQNALPAWFDREFIARTSFSEFGCDDADASHIRLPSKRDGQVALRSLIRGLSVAHSQEWSGAMVSHPYLHHPLVEFLLAIPVEQKLRPGEPRSLMRRALGDVLPEQIVRRKGKQGPAEAFCRALAKQWPRLQLLLSKARICERGYVITHQFNAALARARHGVEPQIFKLLMTISLELWLRSLEQQGATPLKPHTSRCHDPIVVIARNSSVAVSKNLKKGG
jgi:asparagine synthase (glutamine-hydrolysing)